MGKDYYNVLGIAQSANESQIRNAYLSLAKEWHPDLCSDKELATTKFQDISEAFQVLSNAERKELYDKHGEKGLTPDAMKATEPKSAPPKPKPKSKPKKTNTKKEKDKEVEVPPNIKLPPGMQAITPATLKSPFGRAIKSSIITRKIIPVKPKPKKLSILCQLDCTLEELFYGCTKTATWRSWDTNCREPRTTDVKVKPGWAVGHKIDYQDEEMDEEAMIIVTEAKHPIFKRDKDDLLYTADITLKQALCGGEVVVPTIVKDQNLKLKLDGLISPGQVKKIPKHGMTITGKPGARGCLQVTFNIVFPNSITTEQRQQLAEIL